MVVSQPLSAGSPRTFAPHGGKFRCAGHLQIFAGAALMSGSGNRQQTVALVSQITLLRGYVAQIQRGFMSRIQCGSWLA